MNIDRHEFLTMFENRRYSGETFKVKLTLHLRKQVKPTIGVHYSDLANFLELPMNIFTEIQYLLHSRSQFNKTRLHLRRSQVRIRNVQAHQLPLVQTK